MGAPMTQQSFGDKVLSEGLITALAIGGFFIIVGVVFGLTPGITGAINDLFTDFTGVSHPVINGSMILPAPAHPEAHSEVYQAIFNFMLAIGILQSVILGARFTIHSKIKKIAETIGNTIFWLGGSIAAYTLLMTGTVAGWWQFWSMLIILAGASLIAQYFVYLISRSKKRP